MRRRVALEYWEEMKEKLIEKYLLKYYRNYLLDLLCNLRQGYIFVQDYIATFKDLTCNCDMGEHCSQTITRFVLGLRSKIKRAIIMSSHDVDILEEVFEFALKIYLTFNGLLIAKA